MDSSSIMILIFIIILLILSAFFSSAETALMTVNKLRIRTLVEEGLPSAKILDNILNHQNKMLSTILIGNNIVNIVVSSLTTILAQNIWGNYAISMATAVLTVLVLIFGEITPKTAASFHSEKISLLYARVIYILMFVFTPIIFIINNMAFFIMKILRIDANGNQNNITESELRTIVNVSHEAGVIEYEERKIINNLFDFGDATVIDAMIPRVSVVSININATYEELIDTFRDKKKFTRIPVYKDTPENIVGIINMKDIVLYKQDEPFFIKDFIREANYTYEYKSLSELMLEMKRNAISLYIVIDEYGAAVGIITLEDLLEEIVGEIRDEFDCKEAEKIKKISESEYIVEGQMNLYDINEAININLESEDYDSIGGFIIEKLDRLPKAGDIVFHKNLKIVVDSIIKNRVEKAHIYISEKKEEL